MADRNNNGLYFIVGGIVVVALLFFFMSGEPTGVATTDPVEGDTTNISVETPAAEPAADAPAVSVETDSPAAVDAPGLRPTTCWTDGTAGLRRCGAFSHPQLSHPKEARC